MSPSIAASFLALGFMLVLGTAVASPVGGGASQRKPPSAALTSEQIERFVEALSADRRGELGQAIGLYEDLLGASGLAEVHFNLADAYRRSELIEKAIAQYRLYLQRAAPEAADRARVEKLLTTLEGAPVFAAVGARPPGGVLFLDGRRVSSPWSGAVTDGEHTVEYVTATRWARSSFTARKPAAVSANLHASPRTGNVVLTARAPGLLSGGWEDGDVSYRMHHPFPLKAGTYTTVLVRAKHGCHPLTFTVAPPPALTYVNITLGKQRESGCFPFTVTEETVTFDPESP